MSRRGPAAAAAGRSVTLVSVNVNRMAAAAKVAAVLQWAKSSTASILLLQEVGMRENPLSLLKGAPGAADPCRRRGESVYWCPGSFFSKGCLTLVKPNPLITHLDPEAQPAFVDPDGRVLRVDMHIGGHPVSVLNIYAPSSGSAAEKAEFCSLLERALPPPDRVVFVGGDFNMVLSPADVVGGRPGDAAAGRMVGAEHLASLMQAAGLADVWRARHGARSDFTHWSASGRSGARLDRWLCPSAVLAPWAADSAILPGPEGFRTDHLPVSLTLTPPGQGPRLWRAFRPRFRLWMIDDDKFKEGVRAILAGAAAALGARAGGPLRQAASAVWLRAKGDVGLLCEQVARERLRVRRRAEGVVSRQAAAARAALVQAPDAPGALASWQQAVATYCEHFEARFKAARGPLAVLSHLYGETSSAYFHSHLSVPHPPTVITALRPGPDPQGAEPVELSTLAGWALGAQTAEAHFSDPGSGLFRQRPTDQGAAAALHAALPRRLSPSWAADCEGPGRDGLMTGPELAKAVQQSARGRRAGVDGLPYEFYAAFWESIEPLLLAVVNEAFGAVDAPEALSPLLLGVVVLVFKGAGRPADHLSGYRPLTLLNCDVKLLCKAVANRLHLPLDFLVDAAQSAFLCGRDISDSILYHLGLAELLQKRGHPLWVVLSDLANAYDCVDWGFLFSTMRAMGFKEVGHVRWAQLLHQGARSAVVLNGRLSPFFRLRGGLAQGSGASPLYWTIALQPLTAYLTSLAAGGRLVAPELPSGGSAPAVQAYADDCKTLLTDPEAEAPVVREAFALFERASAVALSVPKSWLVLVVQGAAQVPEQGGQHAPSGFSLAGPEPPKRLLGVPFTADAQRAAAVAFDNCHGKLWGTARHFGGLGLSFEGRVHVAKQCLASKLVFQSAFLVAPAAELKKAQRALRAFVTGSSLPVDLAQAARLHPGPSISSLPARLGGVGYPVLAHASASLHAKHVAKVFSFGWHPWKEIMLAEFTAAAGAAGLPSWVVTMASAPQASRQPLLARLAPRLRAYVEAFAATGAHRIQDDTEAVLADGDAFFSCMSEPLFFNARVVVDQGQGRRLLEPGDLPPAVRPQAGGGGWRFLRDVRAAVAGPRPYPAAVAAAVEVVRGALPPAWAEQLGRAVAPAPAWQCARARDGTCFVLPGGVGPDPPDEEVELWRADARGRLVPLVPDYLRDAGPPWPDDVAEAVRAAREGLEGAQWEPAAVVEAPTPEGLWTNLEREARETQRAAAAAADDAGEGEEGEDVGAPVSRWLLGPWASVALDPRRWGHGTVPLVRYTAKHARERVTFLSACRETPSLLEPGGLAPRIWPRPRLAAAGQGGEGAGPPEGGPQPGEAPLAPRQCGLAELEREWQVRYLERRDRPPGRRQVRRREEEWEEGEQAHAAAVAPWVLPRAAPALRPSPAERAARRQAPAALQPAQNAGMPPWDDAADAVAERTAAAAAAVGPQAGEEGDLVAWTRLRNDRNVTREHRVTCWRLLHGRLMTNALRLCTNPTLPHTEGCCALPCCRAHEGGGVLETCSHALLDCPAAKPVVEWMLQLWAALTPGLPQPPRSARLLLADNRDEWQPPAEAAQLWNALRVTTLGCVWHTRCTRAAFAVVTPQACSLRSAAAVVDFLVAAIRRDWLRSTEDVRTLSGDVCSSWFRGRDPALTQQAFLRRWSMGGRLCSVQDARLQLHISHAAPVPVPGRPEGGEPLDLPDA